MSSPVPPRAARTRESRSLVQRIERATIKAIGERSGARILVGVSGGPDSAALLIALRERSERFGWQLAAGHVDHGIARPALRAAFASAAEGLAERLAVPFVCTAVDARAEAEREGAGLEAGARRARYRALERMATEEDAAHIAVGHTMDDQAETVLLHLVRGSGLDGLAGMAPLTALPGAGPNAARLLRPLLGVRRAEVLDLCRAWRVAPVDDPANVDRRFTRNRIRHEILPALAALNPRIVEALARTAREATSDRRTLDELTATAGLRARVLRAAVAAAGGPPPSGERTEALLHLVERGSGQVQCEGLIEATVRRGRVRLATTT